MPFGEPYAWWMAVFISLSSTEAGTSLPQKRVGLTRSQLRLLVAQIVLSWVSAVYSSSRLTQFDPAWSWPSFDHDASAFGLEALKPEVFKSMCRPSQAFRRLSELGQCILGVQNAVWPCNPSHPMHKLGPDWIQSKLLLVAGSSHKDSIWQNIMCLLERPLDATNVLITRTSVLVFCVALPFSPSWSLVNILQFHTCPQQYSER
jgi:hypothetical protein